VIHLGNHGLALASVALELAQELVMELVLEDWAQELVKELEAANLCNMHSLPVASPGNQTSGLPLGTVVHHSQNQCCHLSHTLCHTSDIAYHQATPECNRRIHREF
jgi:hypothetical protein